MHVGRKDKELRDAVDERTRSCRGGKRLKTMAKG